MQNHDDVINLKHFPRHWSFVRGIHRSPVNPPHKGQKRGALIFSLICAWISGWINNREAGDLRRDRAHYDVLFIINWTTWTNLKFKSKYKYLPSNDRAILFIQALMCLTWCLYIFYIYASINHGSDIFKYPLYKTQYTFTAYSDIPMEPVNVVMLIMIMINNIFIIIVIHPPYYLSWSSSASSSRKISRNYASYLASLIRPDFGPVPCMNIPKSKWFPCFLCPFLLSVLPINQFYASLNYDTDNIVCHWGYYYHQLTVRFIKREY